MKPVQPITISDGTNITSLNRIDAPAGSVDPNGVLNLDNGVKVYRALLTQSSTHAPTATVLENTLGGTVVWTYSDVGVYAGTLTAAFTENKTAVNISGVVGLAAGARNDANSVFVTTFLSDDGTARNGVLSSTYVEILIYP